MLITTLRPTSMPTIVYDLGLVGAQAKWLSTRGAQVVPLPADLPFPSSVSRWQAWCKPVFVTACPFDTALWVDADCIVVGDLAPLFRRTEAAGFFATEHWDSASYSPKNDHALYSRTGVRNVLDKQHINSGIIGFRRSDRVAAAIAARWLGLTRLAACDAQVRCAIAWRDEGSLQWALEAEDRVDLIVQERGWNRFMRIANSNPQQFIQALPLDPGDDIIWHFSGSEKPWTWWNAEDRTIPTIYDAES
jgi:lipopolysaccharide biosynthesis glycosyltransferase